MASHFEEDPPLHGPQLDAGGSLDGGGTWRVKEERDVSKHPARGLVDYDLLPLNLQQETQSESLHGVTIAMLSGQLALAYPSISSNSMLLPAQMQSPLHADTAEESVTGAC